MTLHPLSCRRAQGSVRASRRKVAQRSRQRTEGRLRRGARRRTYLPATPKLNLQPSTLAGLARCPLAGPDAMQLVLSHHTPISSTHSAPCLHCGSGHVTCWEARTEARHCCRLKAMSQHLRPLSPSALQLMVHLPKAAPAGMALAPQAYLLSGLLAATRCHLSSKSAAPFGKEQHALHTGDCVASSPCSATGHIHVSCCLRKAHGRAAVGCRRRAHETVLKTERASSGAHRNPGHPCACRERHRDTR